MKSMQKDGAPGGDRTHNLRLRRPTLYPIELQALLAWFTVLGSQFTVHLEPSNH
jgi:hypothetical protein